MKISRKSPLTGKVTEMDLDITSEQINNYGRGALIQDAFPNLSPSEREFVKTGYTQEDWDKIFPPGEED